MRIIVSIRFNWSSYTFHFSVSMPTFTHDIFIERVVQKIGSQLKIVAREDTDIAAVLDLIRLESTSDVYLYGYKVIDDQYFKYTSDVSFIHTDSQYPFIVIETLYL